MPTEERREGMGPQSGSIFQAFGRDSRVAIKLLDATILTVHAEVAGSVPFLGVHRGGVITGYSVYTSLSASEFSMGH